MRPKSPEKSEQQKVVKRPSYRVETERNPETTPQYFQVLVNFLEARQLTWINPQAANSYVLAVLGKKKHRTSVRRNMEEPCYKEHFMFELYSSIRDIQRSSLWLAIMEPRCCAPPRLMGEATIDLGAVWSQPHHRVFHKWAQLTQPRNPATGTVGYLKIDVSIIYRGDIQVMPVAVNDEKVPDNLLLPTGAEQQPAKYVITVYGVFNLANSPHHNQVDTRRGSKLPSAFIGVSFCGLSAKTSVQSRTNHPTICEQINIVEMFPNMNEIIKFDVCCGDRSFTRVLASAILRLGQISHDGANGFLPTFGPSLLHMYGSTSATITANSEDGPYHRGALLLSLKTIVPYYQQGLRTTSVEPVVPINPDDLWVMEDFCIFCPILEVSMLDKLISGKLSGIAMTVGELPSDDDSDEGFVAMMTEIKNRKLYYTGSLNVMKATPLHGCIEFDSTYPVLQLATRLPDFRFRVYRNNMVYGIVAELEQALTDVERRLKSSEYSTPRDLLECLNRAADDAAGNILKFLDIMQYASSNGNIDNAIMKYSTDLDQKQIALQKEEAEKIYQQIVKKTKCVSTMSLMCERSLTKSIDSYGNAKKDLKLILADIKNLSENLKNLIFKTSEGWPDIVIWLLNGGSRVAYSKISIADVIYSVIPEQNGRNCGRIQTIYLKPIKCPKHVNSLLNCFCIAGKVELLLWMGLFRQKNAFETCLPKGYKLKVKDYDMCIKTSTMMLECRAFIYRAKLNNTIDRFNQLHTFVRINVLNAARETKPKLKNMTITWNQVLKINKLVSGSHDRVKTYPHTVLVEVFDTDMLGLSELVGRCDIQPTVDDRADYEYVPKLQWYDIRKGSEYVGQLLMSVQLLQIPELLMKNTVYSPVEETYVAAEIKEVDPDNDKVEPLPSSLIPKSTTYKVDIYWWGLREVIASRKPCVVLEIDDLVIKSDIVTDKKSNCNFPNGRSSEIFQAPLSEVYAPPLSVILYDSSTFGRTLFLGTNVVNNPKKYLVSWLPKVEREASLRSVSITSSNFFQVNQVLYIKKTTQPIITDYESNASLKKDIRKVKRSAWKRLFCGNKDNEEEYVLLPIYSKENNQIKMLKSCSEILEDKDCWWTKYYSAVKDQDEENYRSTDKMTIYSAELETQPEFSKFKDWCTTLKLYNGKKTGIPEKDEQLYCGFLKAGIAIYKWPPPENTIAVSCNGVELSHGYFKDYPNNDPTKFLVRVYIVKGMNLVAKAFTGKLDPYVAISCGNKHLGDRKSYVTNSLNPTFGKMYEFHCNLPDDYLLTVCLMDHDTVPPDELIGFTTIDLEDRIFTKHRARVGLATEYNSTGPNKWRDCYKPSVILEELCVKNHLPRPVYPDCATVVVNGVEYRDNDNKEKSFKSASERKENICLSLLHKWQTLPICGYNLVPEHVETRSLYNNEKSGFELGKLQMWVDIFPLDANVYIPPAIDITPRKLEDYELRVIVWDVQGIKADEYGDKITDLFVRAWLDTIDTVQYTDVHYGSSSAASFNWRMIFRFQYHHAEKKLVRKEKGPFTEVEERFPPIFVVQVLDSDSIMPEEFLGSLSLNLNAIPKGVKLATQCKLEEMDKSKYINLFSVMSIRAWWPLVYADRNTGMKTAALLTAYCNLSMLAISWMTFTKSRIWQDLITVLPAHDQLLAYSIHRFLGNFGNSYYCRNKLQWFFCKILLSEDSGGTDQIRHLKGIIDLELTLLPKEKALIMPVGLGRAPPSALPQPKKCKNYTAAVNDKKVSFHIRCESSSPLHFVKSLHFSWRRDHTLIVIAIIVMFFLIMSIYLEVPQIMWSVFMNDDDALVSMALKSL